MYGQSTHTGQTDERNSGDIQPRQSNTRRRGKEWANISHHVTTHRSTRRHAHLKKNNCDIAESHPKTCTYALNASVATSLPHDGEGRICQLPSSILNIVQNILPRPAVLALQLAHVRVQFVVAHKQQVLEEKRRHFVARRHQEVPLLLQPSPEGFCV